MATTASQPSYISHLQSILTQDEYENLSTLVQLGVPVASLARNKRWRPGRGAEFIFTGWKGAEAKLSHLRCHEPGRALIARTGITVDVIDVDVKGDTDGVATFNELAPLIGTALGRVATPSGGFHVWVPATGMRTIRHRGIDYQAANAFVYLPGTLRPKYDDRPYRWTEPVRWTGEPADDRFPMALHEMQSGGRTLPKPREFAPRKTLYGGDGTLTWAYQRVSAAPKGERNQQLYKTAFHLAATGEAGFRSDLAILQTLLAASEPNGYISEHGLHDTVATIGNGIIDGHTLRDGGE